MFSTAGGSSFSVVRKKEHCEVQQHWGGEGARGWDLLSHRQLDSCQSGCFHHTKGEGTCLVSRTGDSCSGSSVSPLACSSELLRGLESAGASS